MKSGPQLSKLPHKAAESQPVPRGEEVAQLDASEKRRLLARRFSTSGACPT